MIDCFVDVAKRMGKDVRVISDKEINAESVQMEEKKKQLCDSFDLVVSMGSDYAFLKSQALLWDSSIPIMGITTDRF